MGARVSPTILYFTSFLIHGPVPRKFMVGMGIKAFYIAVYSPYKR